MHIAIDDTYGPVGATTSTYVTGARRTHVAVIFPDNEVSYIREQVGNCLSYLASLLPSYPSEFHFTDIYNRKGVWGNLEGEANLRIIEAFAAIYRQHRWKVFLQTIDERTIIDHPELLDIPSLDGLDLANRADLSLQLLCLRLRLAFKQARPPIHLLVDQGKRSPGAPFGQQLFADWGTDFSGQYASSSTEPLLQIADFLAFLINRQTHLALKSGRTETDVWLLQLVSKMNIDCEELRKSYLPADFTVEDFDGAHREDRRKKDLE